MSYYTVNKSQSKAFRKHIDKKREIGVYFRKKENKTWKFKLKKRRRSKRRHLIQSTKYSTFEYIADNVSKLPYIEWNNQPIVSPKNYSVNGNQVHTTKHNQLRKYCILCHKYYNSTQFIIIRCNICIEYICRICRHFFSSISKCRVCINCSIAADICSHNRTSLFCEKYSGNLLHQCCYWRHTVGRYGNRKRRIEDNKANEIEFVAIQRTNKLYEPLKWDWKPGICGYQIDKELVIEHPYLDKIQMDNKYYRIFCKKCKDENVLQTCHYDGCFNKELDHKHGHMDYCRNHKCVTCGRYPIDFYYDRNPSKCDDCKQIYCIRDDDEGGSYTSCGSIKQHKCKRCYIKNETKVLKSAMFDKNTLYHDILEIIYQYAVGYVIMCSNYKTCGDTVCIESSICFESSNMNNYDIDGNRFYYYIVGDEFVNQDNKNELTYIKGKYIRIFCNKCRSDSNSFKRCTYYYCKNYGYARFIDFGIKKRKFIICMNHKIDTVQCAVCSVRRIVAYHTDEYDEICEFCKFCDSLICRDCVSNGKHKYYCKYLQWKRIDHELLDIGTSTFNEELMDYNFILMKEQKNIKNNNAKQSSRKLTKNRKKNKSYWKKQNDKKGNIKFNKRSNKQRLINFELSNCI